MVEGSDQARIRQLADQLAGAVAQAAGASG
jgi:hypothetical protein